jgi:hypothetical protein
MFDLFKCLRTKNKDIPQTVTENRKQELYEIRKMAQDKGADCLMEKVIEYMENVFDGWKFDYEDGISYYGNETLNIKVLIFEQSYIDNKFFQEGHLVIHDIGFAINDESCTKFRNNFYILNKKYIERKQKEILKAWGCDCE